MPGHKLNSKSKVQKCVKGVSRSFVQEWHKSCRSNHKTEYNAPAQSGESS